MVCLLSSDISGLSLSFCCPVGLTGGYRCADIDLDLDAVDVVDVDGFGVALTVGWGCAVRFQPFKCWLVSCCFTLYCSSKLQCKIMDRLIGVLVIFLHTENHQLTVIPSSSLGFCGFDVPHLPEMVPLQHNPLWVPKKCAREPIKWPLGGVLGLATTLSHILWGWAAGATSHGVVYACLSPPKYARWMVTAKSIHMQAGWHAD